MFDKSAIIKYQGTSVRPVLQLTERLFSEQFFTPYLTSQQLVVLESLLSISDRSIKLDVWQELMSGNVTLNIVNVTPKVSHIDDTKPVEQKDLKKGEEIDSDVSSSNDLNNVTANGKIEDDLSQLDLEDFRQKVIGSEFIGNLSLKVRYVIWQCAIDHLCKDQADYDEDDGSDYLLLEDNESRLESFEEISKERINSKSQTEDDDYDEDNDYDEDDNCDENQERSKKGEGIGNSDDIEITKDDNNHMTLTLKFSKDVLSKLRSNNIEDIMKNCNKIYHNFEHDKETMLKRLKLEANDKLLEGMKKRPHGDIDDIDASFAHTKDDTATTNSNKSPPHHPSMNINSDSDEESEPQSGKRPKKDSISLPVNLGAANLSLKHLLSSIQENKSKLKMSDYELKHLIMDVRKNRSKWASDEKIGQEELYEACEKVVLELRNYTEHSTPFLNKVSKREAPNYHQIIKKSMDLNTVLKKLKTFQYKSKQSFVDDVMLIWKNCLTYNSDPSHFLRGHAIAMQKKSLQLLPLIPDIVIRNREDVEKELEEMEKDKGYEDEEEEEEEVAGSGRKGLNMGAHKPSKAHGAVSEETEDHLKNPEDKTQQSSGKIFQENPQEGVSLPEPNKLPNIDESNEKTHEISSDEKKNTEMKDNKSTMKSETQAQTEDEEDEDDEEDEEDEGMAESQEYFIEKDDDKDDVEISVWKSITAKVRAEICIKRSQYFENGELNHNSNALLKNPQKMKSFEQLFAEYKEQKELEQQRKKLEQESIMKNGFRTAVKQEEEEQNTSNVGPPSENSDPFEKETNDMELDSGMFLQEYDVTNSLPALEYQGIDSRVLDKEENFQVKRLLDGSSSKESIFLTNRSRGLSPKINKNIELIQNIRHICHKVSLIRLLQNPASVQNSKNGSNPNQLINSHQYKFNKVDDSLDIDPISQLQTHDFKNNKQLMWKIMHKNVSKILMSSGFETTQPSAANMLTEIAGEYLSNLIKSVKIHHETNSLSHTKSKDILHMSLLENGISNPDDLYVYLESEFTKKTKKLTDVKSKLEAFLKDLLRPTLQELSERNFDDESQSFLTGDFATELTGEDFFGFKDLGLEKEFGVLSSSVPLQLLTFQLQSNDSETKIQVKKIQPEEFSNVVYAKISKTNIDDGAFWGVLMPLLRKSWDRSKSYRQRLAKSNATEFQESPDVADNSNELLIEDDEMVFKAKSANKPRLPPTGKISTSYKKKALSDAFILPEEEQIPTQDSGVTNSLNGEVLEASGNNDSFVIDDMLRTPAESSFSLSLS